MPTTIIEAGLVRRWLPGAGGLTLLLAGCGAGSRETDDTYRFELPQAPVRTQVLALAKCPSPLHRLKITALPRQVSQPHADTIVLTVAASDAQQPIELRFKFKSDKNPGASVTHLQFHLAIPEGAQELELGPGQVIAPLVFTKELHDALTSYFELGAGYQTARPIDNSARIAQKCSEIGRLLDDGAVLISPTLAQEIKRQHRREALNWLFKDDYELRSDAPPDQYHDDD